MVRYILVMLLLCSAAFAWNPVFQESIKLSQKLVQDSDPFIADWNGDGLDDLIVGYRTGSSANIARIKWFENTGTIGNPVFTNRGDLTADGSVIQQSTTCCTGVCNPHIVDYNNDGNMDLIFSTYYGTLYLYDGSDTEGLSLQPPLTCSGSEIDDGFWCGPQLVDWDEDGYFDLLTAGYTGGVNTEHFNLYLNTGEENNALHFQNSGASVLSGMCTDYRQGLRIYDLNMDGKKDIVGGSNNRLLYYHENTGTNSAPVFSGKVNLQTASGDISTSWWRTRLCVWDWNADGTPDLITGDQYGYLYLYLGIPEVGTEDASSGMLNSTVTSLQVLENPVNGSVIPVEINTISSGEVRAAIYDIQGRLLDEQQLTVSSGSSILQLDASHLAAGMVFIRVDSGIDIVSERVLIIR